MLASPISHHNTPATLGYGDSRENWEILTKYSKISLFPKKAKLTKSFEIF